METLAGIDTVVFDKTGTLTKGVFAVDDIHPNNISRAELIDVAAACESFSSHPVAQSIVRAHEDHIEKDRISDVKEIAGKGVEAVIDGTTYFCGNGQLMEMCKADYHDCHLTGTIIHIARKTSEDSSEYLGHIIINDEIKEDSQKTVSVLKKLGIKRVVMLTGDKEKVAKNVADKLGLTEYHAELLPADKVDQVEKLLSEGAKLAFTGDGINDAPVLMRADIGIAM